MKLRTFLNLSASVLGVVGLSTALSLVWTTTLIGRATSQLADAIESVRAAEELEVSLLVHERQARALAAAGDAGFSEPEAQSRDAIDKWLGRVEQHVTSEEERLLVLRVRQQAHAYLGAAPEARSERLRAALDSSDALGKLNVTQARAVRERAERIDRLANASGLISAAMLLAGIAWVVAAARARVYRPLVRLRDGIADYRKGNKGAKVPLSGPDELREIAAEFNDMTATLADQQESQLRFIAGVAHDLRSPLNVLNLSAALLARSEELSASGNARQSLERISRQAGRLNRMVEDLLDRTRIEAGALELRMEDCDLRELAADVVELHRSTADGHVLHLALPDAPVQVRCDTTRTSQVLTNLVNNAIKYSPNGGQVRVSVTQDDGHAYVAVADEGVGIPSDERELIFRPFRRSPSTKADIPGIGLGLSVSRSIVRAHGGEIHVQSAVGSGSTFRVELPRRPVAMSIEPTEPTGDAQG